MRYKQEIVARPHIAIPLPLQQKSQKVPMHTGKKHNHPHLSP